MLRGALAAALTPLTDDGRVDAGAVGPYAAFLRAGGVDGVLCLGTTGEGILFSVAERHRVTELWLEAADGLQVAVHAGAQTTADTVALAAHAAEAGADAVAVIAPPYFRLDAEAVHAHLSAAARACAPTPFYVYEFLGASGYAIPPEVVERLRDSEPNLGGMKVSDAPFDAVRPYLLEGLDVFVGAEALIHEALGAGAAGAVSGLAAAFPEAVAEAVRSGGAPATAHAGALRAIVEGFPRHAALKTVVAERGVPIGPGVRAPLRGLTPDERAALLERLAAAGADLGAPLA